MNYAKPYQPMRHHSLPAGDIDWDEFLQVMTITMKRLAEGKAGTENAEQQGDTQVRGGGSGGEDLVA